MNASTTRTSNATRASGSLSLAAQAGLLAGPFLSMVDSNIVNVALPDIATSLHSTLATAQWIVSGYLLALAAVLPASAYLAKRYGTRSIYLISLLGFTLASLLCAFSPNLSMLIAARVIQGALGAPLVPLAMNMLLGKTGADRQIPVAAGVLLFLAPALGPTIGGLLIGSAGWPSIFLVNVPFGVLGALGVLRIPASMAQPADHTVRFDLFGLLLLAGGLATATYGTTEGASNGWTSPGTWPYLVAGTILLLTYTIWALRRRHPAVDLKLLRHTQSALAVMLSALAGVVMFAMLVLLPIYMQNLQEFPALTAGLALLPQGLVTGLGTVLGGVVAPRWGTRRSTLIGMVILTLSTAMLLLLTLNTPAWLTAILLCGRGLALGLTIQPLLNVMLGNLNAAETADGNTLFNVADRLGGSIGIALLATFFQQRERYHTEQILASLGIRLSDGQNQTVAAIAQLPPATRAQLAQGALAGFHDTILLLVLLSLVGFCLALLLRDTPMTQPSRQNAATLDEQAIGRTAVEMSI